MNWSSNAVIGKVAPLLLQALGAYTYAIFAGLCAAMTVYSVICVPETQGLSLEAMARLFAPPQVPAQLGMAAAAEAASTTEVLVGPRKGAEEEGVGEAKGGAESQPLHGDV